MPSGQSDTQRLLVFSFVFALHGCIAINGTTFQETSSDDMLPPKRKISVYFTNQSFEISGQGMKVASSRKPIVEGYMLNESGYFLTTQSIPGEEDLSFRFKTTTRTGKNSLLSQMADKVYLGLSLVSLGIIPYYTRVYRTLQVKVIQKKKTIKRYRYTSYIVRMVGIFAYPFKEKSDKGDNSWSGETVAMKESDKNIVSKFLEDFHHDFLTQKKSKKK